MAITSPQSDPARHQTRTWWRPKRLQDLSTRLRVRAQPLIDFWTKVNNDWVFNLAGLLAYNFLLSLFPILLVLLAVLGLVLGDQASGGQAQLGQIVEQAIPGGGVVFEAVSNQLTASAGHLLALGVVTSAFAGSRLFIVLENCFGIIFQIRGRAFFAQNLMAFGMLVLYLVLAIIMVLASVVPATLLPLLDVHFPGSGLHNIAVTLSFLIMGVSALLLFGTIYLVVPNRHARFREVWPGTVVATVLLVVYNSLFPLYANLLLGNGAYGAVAGFAVIALIFFYYLAFILLLGAELNAWIAGRRETSGDIAATLHSARIHTTDPRSVPAADRHA